MATVNAYTQINPTGYNPRSLQELMVAPQYMRQQHDTLDAQRAQAEANLAQLDYLDIHDDIVSPEQEKLHNKLNQSAEQLSKEGFSQHLKSDFIGLNQEYQDFLGPKGVGGKAQQIKQQLAEDRKRLRDEAIKMNYSGADIDRYINSQIGNYMSNYTSDRGLEQINLQGAPEYADLQEDIEKAKKLAGTQTFKQISDLGLTPKVMGEKLKFVDSQGQIVEESNIEGLNNFTKYLEELYLKPDSPAAQSMMIRGYSEERMQNMIKSGIAAQLDYKKDISSNSNYIDGGKANTAKYSTNVYTDSSYTKNLGPDIKTYEDATNKVNNLLNSENPSEKIEGRELQGIVEKVNYQLENNEDYQNYNKLINHEFIDNLSNNLGINLKEKDNNLSFHKIDGKYYLSRVNANIKKSENTGPYDYSGKREIVPVSDFSISEEEYVKYKKEEKNIEKVNDYKKEFLNSKIQSSGYLRTTVNVFSDEKGRENFRKNIKATIGRGNNTEVIQIQDKEGKNLNVGEAADNVYNSLRNSKELNSAKLVTQQGKVGYQINYKLDDDYKGLGSKEDSITTFIALKNMYDSETGQMASPTLALGDVSDDVKYDVMKKVMTSNVPKATRDIKNIGNGSNLIANKYFKDTTDDDVLDFYINPSSIDERGSSKYVMPTIINKENIGNANGDNIEHLTWADVITPEQLNNDDIVEKLSQTNVLSLILKQITELNDIETNDEHKELAKKLKEGDKDERLTLLKSFLSQPIRLKSEKDVFELERLNILNQ